MNSNKTEQDTETGQPEGGDWVGLPEEGQGCLRADPGDRTGQEGQDRTGQDRTGPLEISDRGTFKVLRSNVTVKLTLRGFIVRDSKLIMGVQSHVALLRGSKLCTAP